MLVSVSMSLFQKIIQNYMDMEIGKILGRHIMKKFQ